MYVRMRNMDNRKIRQIRIIILTLGVMTLLISVGRCFIGVDITDEALYLAEPHLVSHGSTPYVNNWLQTPGFSFFLAPVVALYELIVSDAGGIFLFMRLFFVAVKILIYVGICILFRNTSYRYISILAAMPLIASFLGAIPTLNYTNIPLFGLIVAGMLLLYQWHSHTVREILFLPFINGIILACITLCGPMQIFNCLLIAVFYLIYIDKRACQRYILGGLFTALVFTLYMTVRAGSLFAFIRSMDILLHDHPYFRLGSSTLSWQAYVIFPVAVECLIPHIICIAIIELLRRILGKEYTFFWSCKIGLTVGTFVGMIVYLVRYDEYALWNRVIILLSIGSFFFRFLSSDKGLNRLFDFVAIPEMVTFLGMMLTVYGGATNRFFVFMPMALICLVYMFAVLREQIGESAIYLMAVYVFLFLVVTLKYEAQSIYGEEEGITALTIRTGEGVYSGILTTEQKAKAVQELENYIRLNTNEDEYVLFLDKAPMAYLMSDAKPCAPTSWDAMLYNKKINDDTIMQKYFEVVHQTPDVIIYIQTYSEMPTSIEQVDYRFSQYVRNNYRLEREDIVGDIYKAVVYSKQ